MPTTSNPPIFVGTGTTGSLQNHRTTEAIIRAQTLRLARASGRLPVINGRGAASRLFIGNVRRNGECRYLVALSG